MKVSELFPPVVRSTLWHNGVKKDMTKLTKIVLLILHNKNVIVCHKQARTHKLT